MPLGRQNDDEDEDMTFEEVSSMADRLGFKGKQRAAYIDDHMTGLGYVPVQSKESYVRPTRSDDEEGGGGWGSRWAGRGGQRSPGSRPGQDREDPDRY